MREQRVKAASFQGSRIDGIVLDNHHWSSAATSGKTVIAVLLHLAGLPSMLTNFGWCLARAH